MLVEVEVVVAIPENKSETAAAGEEEVEQRQLLDPPIHCTRSQGCRRTQTMSVIACQYACSGTR